MVFVTGGTGLVGSHIICELLENKHSVRALYREKSSLEWFYRTAKYLLKSSYEELITNVEWVQGDVLDIISLIDGIQGCHQVYHCAAVVSFSKSDREFLQNVNVQGTANVVNACLGLEIKPDLCFISSTASIGGVEKKMVTEDVPYSAENSGSFYSYTKYLAELEVIRGREEGLNVSILNPSIILGFANWNKGSSKFFKNGKSGFPFYTVGSNAFVDARDVSKAAILITERKCFEGKYLCAAWNLSFQDVFTKIANEFGSNPPKFRVSPRLAEVAWRIAVFVRFFTGSGIISKESARSGSKTMSYSSQKLIDELEFTFRSIDDTISHSCEGYQSISIT
mgnify:CR=1 FL=1